jgi:hypothetical protein
MPFVRIDLMRGKSIEYRKTIGEIVYNAMRDVIDVPKDDKFQVSPNIRSKPSMSARAIWATITAKISS